LQRQKVHKVASVDGLGLAKDLVSRYGHQEVGKHEIVKDTPKYTPGTPRRNRELSSMSSMLKTRIRQTDIDQRRRQDGQ
jgi:hypothetical protein